MCCYRFLMFAVLIHVLARPAAGRCRILCRFGPWGEERDDQVELTARVHDREEERGAGAELGSLRGEEGQDDDRLSSFAPSSTEEAERRDDEFAAEGALAGTDWQVRLGGLIFATAAMVSYAAVSRPPSFLLQFLRPSVTLY